MGEAKLYVIPASHPSRSAMLMLERKGIPYKRVDLLPVVSKGILRARRFPGATVPALKLNGDRIQGSTRISRELDRIQPEPPLFPPAPEKRAKVEEAEARGDEFQQKPRRFSWWALKRNRAPLASYSEGARLGIPVGLPAQNRRAGTSRAAPPPPPAAGRRPKPAAPLAPPPPPSTPPPDENVGPAPPSLGAD